MFSVRVVNHDQDGVSGVRVRLEFSGITRGMSNDVYTDDQGCAEFSGYDSGEIDVYVDGNNVGTYHYADGDSITITR